MLVSLLGYTVAYNTLDNNKNPTIGLIAEIRQDFAGAGGDINFIRTNAEARSYYEVFYDIVAYSISKPDISPAGGAKIFASWITSRRPGPRPRLRARRVWGRVT